MQTIASCCAFLILLTTAGCSHGEQVPVVVGDFCARAAAIDVRPLARPGETVTVGPDGWADKVTLTRRAGEQIAGHNTAVRGCPGGAIAKDLP